MSHNLPKSKCGYRLCSKSLRGLKPKRKFCTPSHRNAGAYLVAHPEARGNQIVETQPTKQGRPRLKSRRCQMPGCSVDISQRTPSKRFCEDSTHNAVRAAAKQKSLNKVKKNRFYEKYGIKYDKNVFKRNVPPTEALVKEGRAASYTGQILVYENYKEPLKPIEKSKGFGYYGTVAMTDDKQLVQCHVCGNLFANVGMHIRLHKLDSRRYKDMYGLSVSTALMSEPEREKRQQRAVKPFDGKLPDHLMEYNRKVQQGLIKHNGSKTKDGEGKFGGWSLEKRNIEGKCPEQVLEKIRELADKLGRTPSYDEFIKEYTYEYLGAIKFQHNTWTEAVHKLGMKTADELRRPDKDSLIEELQVFQKQYGRIPMTSDFNRGLLRGRGVFIRVFGSLNNARIEAGMNAVIPMPFGQIIELPPEKYMDYLAGHVPQKARKHRKMRLFT